MSTVDRGWKTDDEKRYLRKLSEYSENKITRRQLLTNYLNIAEKRDDWADINKGEVLTYCRSLLGSV